MFVWVQEFKSLIKLRKEKKKEKNKENHLHTKAPTPKLA